MKWEEPPLSETSSDAAFLRKNWKRQATKRGPAEGSTTKPKSTHIASPSSSRKKQSSGTRRKRKRDKRGRYCS